MCKFSYVTQVRVGAVLTTLLWTVLTAVHELQSLSLQYCANADIFKGS